MIGALVKKLQTDPDKLNALVPKLAFGVSVLLVVLLADRLAVLTWLMVPEPEMEMTQQPGSGPAPGPEKRAEDQGYEQIATWSLFGKVNERVEKPKAVVEQAPVKVPETQLKLVLRGVYHTEDQSRAMAIIASQGGREEVFAVGQRLPGDAELREVRPERVVLFRQGRYESLSFPESKRGAVAAVRAKTPATTVAVSANRINVTALAARYRENIGADPTSLNDIAQVQPNIEAGVLRGFRLRPGRKRELLRQLGLRPGDIVTNINGVPLDSMAQAMDSLQSFVSADEVQVTVLRNGREIPFTYRLN